MNREAILHILNRDRATGPVALADSPAPDPWELLSHSSDPHERLTRYLDAWAAMDEAAWPEANVKSLYDDIMDIFREYPEAVAWFREWRAAHPEARLC
jgi:hypothetical protein